MNIKLQSLAVVTISLCATSPLRAQVGGGGGGPVEGNPDYVQPVLPTAFGKGICVDYMDGGFNWIQNYPYAGYVVGTSTPYPIDRCINLLSTNDFSKIKQAGFGHIRITLDPWALGMLENASGGPAYVVPGNLITRAAIINAIHDDVVAAAAQGLAVILDFHPTVLAPGAWRNQVNAGLKAHNQPHSETSISNISPPYLGTYFYHFLDSSTANGHPLADFWGNFAAYFDDIPNVTIGFEIHNEPFQTAWDNHRWPDDGENSTDTQVQATAGIPGAANQATWINTNYGNWRATTLAAVNALDLTNPLRANRYALVSNGNQQLESMSWANYKPYTRTETAGFDHIIYAFHLYNPIKFTHPDHIPNDSSIINEAHPYMLERDFVRDASSPAEVYVTPGTVHPVSNVLSNLDTWLSNASQYPTVMTGGVSITPMVMITEFGVTRREVSEQWSGDPGQNGSTVIGTPRDLANAKWAYDVRTRLADRGIGWTWYSLVGQFGYTVGTIHADSNYMAHGTWGMGSGEVSDAMNLGLFGTTRPTP